MKFRLIIILLAVVSFSCGLDTSQVTISAGNGGRELENEASPSEPKLKKLGQNPFFVFEFAEYGDRLLGVGSGLNNEGRYLFTLNEERHIWESIEIWVQPSQSSAREVNLKSLSGIFVRGTDVWLTTHTGSIFRGNPDAGTWILAATLPDNLNHIYFINADVGYATGRLRTGCLVFKTTDGGINWTKIYENEVSGNPFDLYVIDEKTILLAMNDEYILRSEDGGETWEYHGLERQYESVNDPAWVTHDISGASGVTEYDGFIWVVGERGSLFYSKDAGKAWSRPTLVPETLKNQKLNSIDISKDGRGLAVGDNGLILFTIDGGSRWYELSRSSIGETLSDFSNRKTDDLIKVKFVGESALVLGRAGTYQIMF